MAYEVLDLGNGKRAIRVTYGPTVHIVKHETWTVEEDEHHRVFPSYGTALDCAREIAGDPDLPPLTQI